MFNNEQSARYQAQGFIKGPRVLDDAAVEELRAEVDRVIRDKNQPGPQPVVLRNIGKPGTTIWQIVDIWMASPAFKRLLVHPAVVTGAAQLTGARDLRLWHDQIQYKIAGTGGVNMWHQDWPYWGVLNAPHQVTAWIALDDVDVDNGCMSMVPGSHLWGRNDAFLHSLTGYDALPTGFQGHRVEGVYAPVGKGEVHFHHAMTWHGSHANQSHRPRRAIALHYMTELTCYVARGTHEKKPFITVADGAPLTGDAFPQVWPLSTARNS
jgi:phytanoyl-CoA hydroxylase